MISVGETLRRERLRRNLDLDQISHELKISAKFLDAIENEQFDRLPARIFAKSFVRQYAHLLELDEDELGDEVQRQLQPPPANPHDVERTSSPSAPDIQLPRVQQWEGGMTPGSDQRASWSSSLPALALFVVILLVCSGIYSWWQRNRRTVSAHENSQAAAPVAQVESAPLPPPAGNPLSPGQPGASPAPAPGVVPEQPPPGTVHASEARPEVPAATSRAPSTAGTTQPAVEPAAPSAADNTPPAIIRATTSANPTVRVEITAGEAVWVLAQNNGKYLFSGTLEPSQTRTIEADGTVTLRLGNAGGVNILLNGKPIGAVGPRGQVRTVQFTSGGFHIVPVPKPSPPLDDMP